MPGRQQLPLLSVSVTRAGDTAVLRLDGELDCATAPLVDDAIQHVLGAADQPARLLVDVEALTFVDVSGLRPLIDAGQRMAGRGSFQVRNGSRQVVRVIRLLDLAELLGVDR